MKFNLKNRPSGVNEVDIRELRDWFSGFEKELRETCAWLEQWNPEKLQNAKSPEWNQGYKEAWKWTIKEILGEEEEGMKK
jgi:hypothetical protein